MRSISQTFENSGVTGILAVRRGESFDYSVTSSSANGTMVLERSVTGGSTWQELERFTDSASGSLVSEIDPPAWYRFRYIEAEEPEGEMAVTLEDRDDVVREFFNREGALRLRITDAGLDFYGEIRQHSSETVRTNGDAAVAVNTRVYKSVVVSSGSEGAEDLEVGDGTDVEIGTRKLIVFGTRTHASDSIVLDDTNISQGSDTITAVELDAADEFILLEWHGTSWEVIAASAGVVTTE